MGWCSGTETFDAVCKIILEPEKVDKKKTIQDLIESMWDIDWDCVTDSNYIYHPIVKEALIELDEDYKEWYEEMEEE